MCGIIGYVGGKNVTPILMEGLRRLEYRGYDSAGICVLNGSRDLTILRAVGKLGRLVERVRAKPPKGSVGIGHSRWATHGKPSEENAHPHTDCTGKLVVIHNGIIENYREIKERLARAGHEFASETDTEILAHLFEEKIKAMRRPDLREATRRALKEVRGAYAIAVVWAEDPETLVAAKTSSPLVVGFGKGETFLASDVPAFIKHTRRVIFLEDGEMAVLRRDGAQFYALSGRRIVKKPHRIKWDRATAEKAGFKHFMLKEIYDQPQTVADTLRGRLYPVGARSLGRESGITKDVLKNLDRVQLLACGTAHHAGMIARYWLEHFAGVPADAELASEFRYREPILGKNTLTVAVSQSGETADTLAAVALAKRAGSKIFSICNCVGSALTREADFNFLTHCGPEYGVASTKAFMGQMTALALFALHLGIAKGNLKDRRARAIIDELVRLPGLLRRTLKLDRQIRALAGKFYRRRNFIFVGRHVNYPLALEGALKLKEISYIHAEGYAAGELKHGPIALIDDGMPIVALATDSRLFEKVRSNIEEAKARGADVIAVVTEGEKRLKGAADHILEVPRTDEFLAPFVSVLPLQLLSYYIARLLGCDVDQPRNLAKSVTVE